MACAPCAPRWPSEVSVPYDVNHALEHQYAIMARLPDRQVIRRLGRLT
jgi:hypothetical protein